MNLSPLSLADLKALAEQVRKEIGSREQDEVRAARDQIFAIAQSIGIPLSELLESKAIKDKKSSKPAAVKFRHPDDTGKVWTGRGRKPAWVIGLESAGEIDKARV